MTRFREFLAGLLTLVLLAVGLGIWIRLPWPAVLAITLGLALWLFLTRSGRLAREATAPPAAAKKPRAKSSTSSAKKTEEKGQVLADWLAGRQSGGHRT